MIDEDQLVRLLVGRRSSIIAYAMSIVFSHDLAEEVYQNVVVVVLRKKEEVNPDRDPIKWVLGVTRVEALVALRKRGRSPQAFDESVLDLMDESWDRELEDWQRQPECVEALRRCLSKLTKRSQKVLQLRYTEGLSGEKLAERLGVKLNTAYVTLSRIHRQLRGCVGATPRPSPVTCRE